MKNRTKSLITELYYEWFYKTNNLSLNISFYDYCNCQNLFNSILVEDENINEIEEYVKEISDNA